MLSFMSLGQIRSIACLSAAAAVAWGAFEYRAAPLIWVVLALLCAGLIGLVRRARQGKQAHAPRSGNFDSRLSAGIKVPAISVAKALSLFAITSRLLEVPVPRASHAAGLRPRQALAAIGRGCVKTRTEFPAALARCCDL